MNLAMTGLMFLAIDIKLPPARGGLLLMSEQSALAPSWQSLSC